MIRELWIPFELPGMNEIVEARAQLFGPKRETSGPLRKSNPGTRRSSAYTRLKKSLGKKIAAIALAHRLPRYEMAHFGFIFVESTRRRDPDNLLAGQKFILDALQPRHLAGDGWGNVLSLSYAWRHADKGQPGVMVLIGDSEREILAALGKLPAERKTV